MKKISRPLALQGQSSNNNSGRSTKEQSSSAHAFPYDLKKSILPRSLDLMFTLKYRR